MSEAIATAYFAIGAAFGIWFLCAIVRSGEDALADEWRLQQGYRHAHPRLLAAALTFAGALFWPIVVYVHLSQPEEDDEE